MSIPNHIDIAPHSPQPLRKVVIGMNPDFLTHTNLSHNWRFSSTKQLSVTSSSMRISLNSSGNGMLPGEELTIELRSSYGPVIVPIYAKGRAQRFPRPAHVGKEAFTRHPTTVEGVQGKTIAPGVLKPEDSEDFLRAALEDGLQWGWLNDSAYQKMRALNHEHSDIFSGIDPHRHTQTNNVIRA